MDPFQMELERVYHEAANQRDRIAIIVSHLMRCLELPTEDPLEGSVVLLSFVVRQGSYHEVYLGTFISLGKQIVLFVPSGKYPAEFPGILSRGEKGKYSFCSSNGSYISITDVNHLSVAKREEMERRFPDAGAEIYFELGHDYEYEAISQERWDVMLPLLEKWLA